MDIKKFFRAETWIGHQPLTGKRVLFSWKDCLTTAALFSTTSALCLMLRGVDKANDSSYVAMLFLLDVFLTAMLTEGYLFSILSAVLGVLAVDYVFTPPYWQVSFVITGFPLTFFVMMFISVATAMLTSRARRAAAAAREAERQKTYANLLRAVSHDIRTPLTSIVGITNVLLEQEEKLSPQQRHRLLGDANEEAQWLIRVVENLLSITRIDGEKTLLCKDVEPMEEVIEGSVSKFSRRYPAIQTVVDLPEDLLMVPMEPLLIQQVLSNLLENAVTHGKTTSCITVSLRKNGDVAQIVVADNGCGIAPERMDNVFEGHVAAQQGDIKRNMGIGLSVCRTIIHAHGGTITAQNNPAGGAEFRIELPIKEENDDEYQG